MVIKNKKTTKYSGVNFAKKVRETFPNFSLITYTHELENELKGCRSILDVGCGKNSPLRLMSKMYTKTGVDGFISAISESKKKGIHDDYYHMYIKGLGKKFKSNSYDAVVALDVIEHLTRKDGERLLRDMERVARKKVILVTPNGFVPQHKKENLLEEHLSGWTKNDFTKKGYKVKGVYGWKALRKHGAEIVYEPKILVGLLSELTHYFWTRRSVKHSYSLMASKTI